MQTKNVLVIGCGDLGIRLAQQLLDKGFQVSGLRRSVDKLPEGINKIAADITQPASLAVLSSQRWDIVIVTLTARGEAAYKAVYIKGLSHVIAAIKASQSRPLMLFASSTSVYAQQDGQVINEQSETTPSGYSGKVMLQAEQLVAESTLPYSVIRLSGIYGRGRGGHLTKVLNSGRICPALPEQFSNRMHIDDCVGVFMHLITQHLQGKALHSVYLGNDQQPAPLREVMEWLALQHHLELASLQENYLPARGGSKQCSSLRLQQSGYQFLYSSFKQGFLV